MEGKRARTRLGARQNDKIFVAGGSGMVGSALIRRLLSHGYSNIISTFQNQEKVRYQESPVPGIGVEITIKELAEMIKEIVKFEGQIIGFDTKPDGTPQGVLGVSKFNYVGWKPKISLEEGIQATYEWYFSVRTQRGAGS